MRNTSPLIVQPPFDRAPFIGSRILSPRSDWPAFIWSVTEAAIRACAALDRPRHSKTPQDMRPTTLGIVAMGASLVRCENRIPNSTNPGEFSAPGNFTSFLAKISRLGTRRAGELEFSKPATHNVRYESFSQLGVAQLLGLWGPYGQLFLRLIPARIHQVELFTGGIGRNTTVIQESIRHAK